MAKEPLTIRDFLVRGMSALLPSPEGKKPLFRYEGNAQWEKVGRTWYVDILGAAFLMEYKARYGKLPKSVTVLDEFAWYIQDHRDYPVELDGDVFNAQRGIFNAPDAVQYVYEYVFPKYEAELDRRPLAPFKH